MPQYAEFQGFIEFTDRRRIKTTRRFNLDLAVAADGGVNPGERYDAAILALADLVAAISPLTTAEITRTGIINNLTSSEDIGAVGSEVTNEALLKYAIEGTPGKVWTWGLPSPAAIVFTGDNDLIRVSPTQTEVAAFSNNLAVTAYVSDGEEIDTAQGTNGLLSGVWRSKQKRGMPS